jgi:hypothetical protein
MTEDLYALVTRRHSPGVITMNPTLAFWLQVSKILGKKVKNISKISETELRIEV